MHGPNEGPAQIPSKAGGGSPPHHRAKIRIMNRYPDEMLLEHARTLFFKRSNLGEDGGYSSRWVRIESKPLPFYFPNSRSRVAAARLHDLHHITAEYETDWPGEAETSAWEIASG